MNNLLLDRDGVLIKELGYSYTPEAIQLLPGITEGLKMLPDYSLYIVSNQSGIGRGLTTVEMVDACNARLIELLNAEGITISDCVYCPHHPDDGCNCRKPALGMWNTLVERHALRAENCIMVGNRESDIAFAKNIGCRSVFVRSSEYPDSTIPADAVVNDLVELAGLVGAL